MNSELFIDIIKKVVRDPAIFDTLQNLQLPPGRGISVYERERSDWFNSLSDNDRSKIESIVKDAVDEAVFGLLTTLDGSRAIENDSNKGRLKLVYEGKVDVVLNDPEKIALHDLYNDKE